ncbi:hypothetical protein CEXT_49841 [Caerostris extrusa]|uniref:Uncharacterized protein n=1 Tax=Caerostris extrusa TaxID=172846 RepID=A0AAV4UKX2_CAEEX|nr:hypothetical protein CEXT_49841 [Caerostris extrusa]
MLFSIFSSDMSSKRKNIELKPTEKIPKREIIQKLYLYCLNTKIEARAMLYLAYMYFEGIGTVEDMAIELLIYRILIYSGFGRNGMGAPTKPQHGSKSNQKIVSIKHTGAFAHNFGGTEHRLLIEVVFILEKKLWEFYEFTYRSC